MKTQVPQELVQAKKIIDRRLAVYFRSRIHALQKTETKLVPTYKLLSEYCLRGGKRLRGYLVVLGYKIGGKKPNAAIYDVACGIELIHAALLIHDDIIDNDDMRRGESSLHTVMGKSEARDAANILSSLALEIIWASDFSDTKKVACARALGFGSVSTAVGEIMDIVYSHRSVTQRLVESVLRLKTARYSVSEPLVLGYLLAGGKKYADILHKAGEAFGTAFQVRDDTLGVVGAKSYQSRGGDLREAKPFILAPKIAALLSAREKQMVRKMVDKKVVTDSDVDALKDMLLEKHLPKYAFRLAEKYIEKAKQQFSQVVTQKMRHEVFQIIDYVISREE